MSVVALSPLDGRYHYKVEELSNYFSEAALIKYRIVLEIDYLRSLSLILPELECDKGNIEEALSLITSELSEKSIFRVKEIELETNHDVKAIEYHLKELLVTHGLEQYQEFVHFGLTSQDINNTVLSLQLKDCICDVIRPSIENITSTLDRISADWKNIVMLSRTHGQPASPTTLRKELFVFVNRITIQKNTIDAIPFTSKFSGAVGNFNAHIAAYPEIDWCEFSDKFLEGLGITRNCLTTQIEPYDNTCALFDNIKRINSILIDMVRDIWMYISLDYFKLKIVKGEVGSSTMPHKVNPIDFENAEGNLMLSNALLSFMSEKLPISRLQRDLTDSTVLRNVGVMFGYSLLAYKNIVSGLEKLRPNRDKMNDDLEDNWVIVSEGIQTILKRHGYQKPYEMIKELTRTDDKVNREHLHRWIDSLNIMDNELVVKLKTLTPQNYLGNLKFG
jgi:adenylosuccinate lyase